MIIRNFSLGSEQKLLELRDSLGLSMDIQFLSLCKENCARFGKAIITDSELRILDEIFKATPPDASNAAINEVLCENNDIIATFNDLLTKRSHISEASSPLSLASISKVSGKYMNSIGIKTPSLPEELDEDIEDKEHSLIEDIIDAAKYYDKNSLVTVVTDRLHNEQFKIDAEAFSNYFLAAINKTIDAVLSFITYGYDRQLISLYLKYNFPKDADSKTLGNCLAMILGAYRVTCELCITDVSRISFTSSENLSLSAYPFVKKEKAYMPSKLNANGSKLYLLSFSRLENGMPDFKSFRSMCDLYHIFSSHGEIKSALSINGNLRDAISKAEGAFRFIPSEKGAEMLNESFCGILFESYIHPKNAILLGSVEQIPQETDKESCGTDEVNKSDFEENTTPNDTVLAFELLEKSSKQSDSTELLEQIEKNTQRNIEENSQIC